MSAPARERAVLAVLCCAAFMASLDVFIVNIAFASIGREFHGSSVGDLSWVLNGYAILYASLMVPFGRLADRVGRRATFLAGLALFLAGSVACGAADALWVLVACRAVQAIGAAALTPSSLALVMETSGPERRSTNVQIWAATGSLAAAAGPVLGGLLVEASWRWVFLLNLPVGIAAFAATLRLVAPSRDQDARGMPDIFGAILLSLGVGAATLALVSGERWGWESARIAAAAAVAVAALAWFARRTTHHPLPVLDRDVLRLPRLSWSNVVLVGLMVAFSADLLTTLLWLQEVWGWSVLHTGLAILPGPLVVLPAAAVAERLSEYHGARVVIAAGCALFGLGTALIAITANGHPAYAAAILPGWTISGWGFGMVLPTVLATATSELPARLLATGSALLNMSRQLGAVLGVTLLVVVTGGQGDALGVSADHLRDGWWLATVAGAVAAAIAAVALRPARAERRPPARLVTVDD